jgi:hypothetical protein
MDRITDITEFSGTFEETARRIEKFNHSRGGFGMRVNQALQQIPLMSLGSTSYAKTSKSLKRMPSRRRTA